MRRLEFRRIDLRLILRRTQEGGARVRIEGSGDPIERTLDPSMVATWLALPPGSSIPEVVEALSLAEPLRKFLSRARRSGASGDDERRRYRITLNIEDPELSALAWESSLSSAIPSGAPLVIVRTSPVRPRVLSIPLTLPLRILQVDPQAGRSLQGYVRSILGGHRPTAFAPALQVRACKRKEIRGWQAPYGWPTVEVAHFDSMFFGQKALLSTAFPESAGTLGWLSRLTDVWQTRLVVLHCRNGREAAVARRLAAALVARGGPAVLVGDMEPGNTNFYKNLYDRLVHDDPFDEILFQTVSHPASGKRLSSLFAGAGREEALRVSNIGLDLLELDRQLSKRSPRGSVLVHPQPSGDAGPRGAAAPPTGGLRGGDDLLTLTQISETTGISYPTLMRYVRLHSDRLPQEGKGRANRFHPQAVEVFRQLHSESGRGGRKKGIGKIARRGLHRPLIPARGRAASVEHWILGKSPSGRTASRRLQDLQVTLGEFRDESRSFSFERSERGGLLPLAKKIARARRKAGVMRRAPAPATAVETAGPPPPRYLNASLWRERRDGDLRRLDPRRGQLRVGESCHLGLQIGPRDKSVPVFGAEALFEEVFKWTPETPGVWVEIGVTGIDFKVVGDPVQELWLPREGASESLYFNVVPCVTGAARLRFCLYFQGNLIQSFRLAALVLPSKGGKLPRSTSLARALGLDRKQGDGWSYLARLEYSLGEVGCVASQPRRTVSIVANDLDGKSVITVKSPNLFSVNIDTNNDLPDAVSAVRKRLQEISTPPIVGVVDPNLLNYGFGRQGHPNQGSPEVLSQALCRMAEVGWDLFSLIVPGPKRAGLADELDTERQTISVAHILLEKVVPWGAIYDVPFSPNRRIDPTGHPVEHTACLAALPRSDGTLPAQRCGEHPDCLLHEDRVRRLREAGQPVFLRETVACPLHFWGFKHVLEIPPQQVDGNEEGTSIWKEIVVGPTAQLAVGLHAKLSLASQHEHALEALAQQASFPSVWKYKSSQADVFLEKLKDPDLDLIYFYCHARGGLADPTIRPPYLEMQDDASTTPDRIKPAELSWSQPWLHHPLVILNGCGTVAFSPDALSPFIRALVRDRGAAGVLGTEIPVWEQLATEVASQFLRLFLDGKMAGESLLEVRRALLSQYNPLGLVYTLYASAELALVHLSDEAAGRQ